MQVEFPITTVKCPAADRRSAESQLRLSVLVTVIDLCWYVLTGVVGQAELARSSDSLAYSDTSGSMTRAVSGNECGLPAAVSAMMKVAVEAIGLKMFTVGWMPTPIVQLFPAGNVAGKFLNHWRTEGDVGGPIVSEGVARRPMAEARNRERRSPLVGESD